MLRDDVVRPMVVVEYMLSEVTASMASPAVSH